MACALPPPGGGGKRGRDTKVSLPLLTPQPFLWTRLPSVARLKTRGPQGRLVLQGHILDRSGAFRSRTLPLCTVRPRTVMRGSLRKVNSGHNSIPKSARRTELSPVSPVSPRDQRASRRKGGFGGSQEGAREPYGALAPFCLRRQTAAFPPVNTGSPRPPKAANDHALRGRKVAFSGTPLYRWKILRLLTRKRKKHRREPVLCFSG